MTREVQHAQTVIAPEDAIRVLVPFAVRQTDFAGHGKFSQVITREIIVSHNRGRWTGQSGCSWCVSTRPAEQTVEEWWALTNFCSIALDAAILFQLIFISNVMSE